jgi:hypothetical protein
MVYSAQNEEPRAFTGADKPLKGFHFFANQPRLNRI